MPTPTTKPTVEHVRGYLDQLADLNRALLDTAAAPGEANLKSAFDVQNAAIEAGFALFDAAVAGTKGSLKRTADAARQGQPTVLEAFQATAKLLERVAADAAPAPVVTR